MNNETNDAKAEKVDPQKEETKTYTKEDIDNSFNAGVKKANTDWQKDERYKKFLDWEKSNKSDEDLASELENKYKGIATENTYLKAEKQILTSDVKKEFSEFVTTKVLAMVSDSIDLKTALANYKKENPQFFGETVVKKVQSSPSLNGGAAQAQTPNSIMNEMLRSTRNN